MKYFCILLCCITFLTACSDDKLAPVVNAWHQKGAASNFYVVQENDTIYSVAFAFELDYRDIATLNHLAPPYSLHPGERITMPTSRSETVAQHPVVTKDEPVFSYAFRVPTQGKIIRRFSSGYNGYHGIAIGGNAGQPIRAAATGQIVYSGDGVHGYGNLIIIKHGSHYLTAYAFNQRNAVHVGDRVRAGEVIARMGRNDAGRAMLYFEIRRNGVPMNPAAFIHP